MIFIWSFFSPKKERKIKFTIVALNSLDLITPSVINVMFESFTCFEFEGEYYLRKDMGYLCYTKNHILKVKLNLIYIY